MLLHRYTPNWYISLSLLQHFIHLVWILHSRKCGDFMLKFFNPFVDFGHPKSRISEHSLWLHLHILMCSTGAFISLLQQISKKHLFIHFVFCITKFLSFYLFLLFVYHQPNRTHYCCCAHVSWGSKVTPRNFVRGAGGNTRVRWRHKCKNGTSR